ncbi:MAG: hypothetical protein ABIR96_02195 [Bdellovibrionota bacterium]
MAWARFYSWGGALALGALSSVVRADKPRDWSGELVSAASRFRSDTGVTHPILYALPEWSRSNAADLDLVTRNSAGLAILDDSRRRFVPLAIGGDVVGKVYDVTNAFKAPGPAPARIIDDLQSDGSKVQRMKATAQGYYLMQNFAYSLSYTQQRNIWMTNSDQTLMYQFYRDIWLQFSSGGQVFDSSSAGRLDFGVAVKGIIRLGSEKVIQVADLATAAELKDSAFLEQGLAIGLDYSLLWTSPNFEASPWGFQLGLVGKDIGTTAFMRAEPIFEILGYHVGRSRKFPIIPNDTIAGVGIKLPNFRDGLRSALRLEWNQWTRPIPAGKKWAASYELRFPFLASIYAGYRGGAYSGGVGLRFRGVELDLGTFTDLWGNGDELIARRAWMMELRSVF